MRRKFRYINVIISSVTTFLVLCFLLVQAEKTVEDPNIASFGEAIWYGVVTLTTVGYGDFYPISPAGRIIGGVFILGSLGILGYLISQLSNAYQNYMENKKNGYYGTDFTEHYIIIGWNSFAKHVATEIYNSNKKIAIVTNQKVKVDGIKQAFPGDNVFVLLSEFDLFQNYTKINLENANSLFINFEDDTQTLVFLLNLQKQYATLPKTVIALDNPDLKETYKHIGIDCTIATQDIASKLVASYIFEPDVAEFTEDLIQTSVGEDECDIIQMCIDSNNPICNQNYFDMFVKVKRDYNTVLIGLSRIVEGKRKLIKNPNQEERILENDCVIMINDKKDKERIIRFFKNETGVV